MTNLTASSLVGLGVANMYEAWWWVTLFVIFVLVALIIEIQIQESNCQVEHNVADCAWIVVPVVPAVE